MIIAQVLFPQAQPMSLEAATAAFKSTAPKYKGLKGLQRKFYLRSEDGMHVGGLYFWESRAAAEAVYDDAWRTMVTAKYGTAPEVRYFDAPVSVDNTVGVAA